MHQRDGLPVLREESAIRHIHQLQLAWIVIDLQRHGVDILRPRDNHIDREGRALRLRRSSRIEQETELPGVERRRERIAAILRRPLEQPPAAQAPRPPELPTGVAFRPASLARRNSSALAVPTSSILWFDSFTSGPRTMCGIRTKTISFSRFSLCFRREEIFQERNLRQSRECRSALGLLVFQDSAEQVDFAFLQADLVLDLALPDDRLADAADILERSHRRNIHRHLQRDFASGMHARRDVDVHADIEILELGIDQRVDADAADARLERSGRHRNAVADLQRRLLSIESADLRILNNLVLLSLNTAVAVAAGIVT